VNVNLTTGEATGDGTDRIAVTGPRRLVGSDHADRLVGTKYYDEILAGLGADTAYGLESSDLLALDGPASESGQEVSDTAYGGAGNDVMSAGGGGDHLLGGPGNDEERDYGSRGGDTLEGGDGNDYLDDAGATAPNSLDGQAGNDQVLARIFEANLTLAGGPGTDRVMLVSAAGGAPGADLDIATGAFWLYASVPVKATLTGFETYAYRGDVWTVHGSAASDFVDAVEASEVHMTGLGADDSLRGGAGDDVFDGGAGTGDCFQQTITNGTDSLTNVEDDNTWPDQCPWP